MPVIDVVLESNDVGATIECDTTQKTVTLPPVYQKYTLSNAGDADAMR